MPTVDLDVGGVQHKSYASLKEANEYLAVDLRFKAAWEAMDDEAKSAALAYATRKIDSLSYSGSKADSNQENEFPRDGQSDIPAEVTEATILLAGYYSSVPQASRPSTPRRLKRLKAGQTEFEYFDRDEESSSQTLDFPEALELLRQFLAEGASTGSPRPRANVGGNRAVNSTDWAGRLA